MIHLMYICTVVHYMYLVRIALYEWERIVVCGDDDKTYL